MHSSYAQRAVYPPCQHGMIRNDHGTGTSMTARYSTSYCFTTHTLDSDGIVGLRLAARAANARLREVKHPSYDNEYIEYFTVRCKGRLGKNNPAAKCYHGEYRSIRAQHATRWDVYLQLERRYLHAWAYA